ncbi:MAG: LytTR family DNA-binding domain-containing protein [Wenzhouxiangellaceae bacterium]
MNNPQQVPFKTLVADDEALARELLCTLVQREPGLSLVGQCEDGLQVLQYLRHEPVDLLLLDIQMPGLNGMQLARQLTAAETSPYIIFITAYQQHAIEAFEHQALDYLVKPVAKQRFAAAIGRAVQVLRQQQIVDLAQRMLAVTAALPGTAMTESDSSAPGPPTTITVRRGEELIRLLPTQIVWVEAASQYVYLHTRQGRFMLTETLGGFTRQLPAQHFIRVHRSALINLNAIDKISQKPNKLYQIRLNDGALIPLARSRNHLLPTLLEWASRNRGHS